MVLNPFPKPPASAQKICPYMMIPTGDKFGVKGMNFGTCVGDKCGKFNDCSGIITCKQLSDIAKSNYNGQV